MRDCLEPLPAIKKYHAIVKEKKKQQQAAMTSAKSPTASVNIENATIALPPSSFTNNDEISRLCHHRIDMTGECRPASSTSSNDSTESRKEGYCSEP
jgi:hypothetical protein